MWRRSAGSTARSGLTILLTTHYLEEADELAAQLAIVDRGRIVAAGTPDELKSALQGDALQVELAEPPPTATSRGARARAGLSELVLEGRTACARATTARPRCRRCSPRCTRRATPSPRSPSPAPRSTTSTCAYAGRAFAEADSEPPEEAPR